MRVALVHDWLNNLGGAERVLIELHKIFPDASIYALFYNKKFVKEHLPDAKIIPSGLQKFPFVTKTYPFLLPLMPSAIESFDMSDYDVVISSSVIFSKGLILKPKTRHICYCYSPTRFLWDRHTEYEHSSWPAKLAQHLLRIWDRQASERVDTFVAISENVRDRIQKYYRRDAKIIYPPVSITTLKVVNDKSVDNLGYYLIVSRLHPYKNIDIAIEAFNKLVYELVVVGDGPDMGRLKNMAGKNIKLVGYKSDKEVAEYYRNCKAFIMPQEEDFGLTPLEAMSFGKPVLALRKGGALETITEGLHGEFFDDPIPEALADGIRRLNENYGSYDQMEIRYQAMKFSTERFKREILELFK
ncbi:MAG: glycosyltransferase [Candidatus Yanofskybacteria bacterium]|nr:glycosyltransferase [Candidatus Yanofskybacteria bacterium]